VAGIAFGAMLKTSAANIESAGELTEIGGELLALTVWFIFGAVLLPVAFDAFGADVALYAVLSLTLVRILPVALALVGSGTDRYDMIFIAWFGPRGLASVVFAILAYEGLDGSSLVPDVIGTLAFTIGLSVLLHGITGGLPGRHYAGIESVESDATTGPRARPTSFE
jgi:NhaP-type Na+/H+ or K+/H+ antiporter